MGDFVKIDSTNIHMIQKIIMNQPFGTCDYTAGSLYMWRDFFDYEYYQDGKFLYIRTRTKTAFLFPTPIFRRTCEDPSVFEEAIITMRNDFNCRTFLRIPEVGADLLKFMYDDDAVVVEKREYADYIYEAKDFRKFAGKKYHGQKNHINKFKKTWPEYKFVEIKGEYVKRTRDFWLEVRNAGEDYYKCEIDEKSIYLRELYENKLNAMLEYESIKMDEMITMIDKLGLCGGAIEVDDKIVAFSIGEIIGDTLYIHVEKAVKNMSGLYTVMAHEFAKRYTNDEVIYINREEDEGDVGMRKSKLDYHPIYMKKKYDALFI